MKRKIRTIIAIMLLVCCSSHLVYAVETKASPHPDSEVRNINLDVTDEKEIKDPSQTKTDGYTYWKVTSKTNQGTVHGSWRLGPQGRGPGTVAVSKNDTVTNTISGSYTSVGAISSSLGVSINVAKSYSVSYSVNVPSGKTYQIKYRPLYTKYKVVQTQYYKIDGVSSPTGQTKTCYVNVFYDWGFSYNVVN